MHRTGPHNKQLSGPKYQYWNVAKPWAHLSSQALDGFFQFMHFLMVSYVGHILDERSLEMKSSRMHLF